LPNHSKVRAQDFDGSRRSSGQAKDFASPIAVRAAVRRAIWRCAHYSAAISAGALLLGPVSGHCAAEDAAATPTTQLPALKEIVVTAQRRSQTVQDIPYAIMAVDATQIQQSGATTLDNLTKLVPGLSTVDQGLDERGGVNNLALRGLRTDAPGGGSGPIAEGAQAVSSVATYYGESPVFFAIPFVDIDRIEVLEGPQGTLYGSGAQAGAIRIIPNKPSFGGFSGEVNVRGSITEHSNDPNRDGSIVLNVPLADRLALRLIALDDHEGGFITDSDLLSRTGNGFNGVPIPSVSGDLTSGPVLAPIKKYANTAGRWFAKAALRWSPNSAVDFEIDYLHQHTRSDDCQCSNPYYRGGPVDFTTPSASVANGQVSPGIYPNSGFDARAGGPYTNTNIAAQPYNDAVDLVSGVATIDAGLATVTSATSYFKDDSASDVDFTASYFKLGVLNGNSYYPYLDYPRLTAPDQTSVRTQSFIQEVRVVSNGADNLIDYVGGLYYENQKNALDIYSTLPGIQDYLNYIGQPNPSTLGDLDFIYHRNSSFQDKAIYGEITWHLTKAWQVTGGARVFHQDFSNQGITELPLCGAFCSSDLTNPLGLSGAFAGQSISRPVFKLNTAYDINPETKIYATYSEGFRRGGANAIAVAGVFASLPIYQTFLPDLAKNYEIGIKGMLARRMIRYSADVFWIDLSNFQFDALNLAGYPATYNGSQARSKGIEMQWNARLGNDWSLGLGYAYTTAVVTKSFNLVDYAPYALIPSLGGTGEEESIFGGPIPKGSSLPGVAKHSVTLNIDYKVPAILTALANQPLTLHVDGSYHSSSEGFITNTSIYSWEVPSALVANARASYALSEAISLDLFVNNITSATAYSGSQNATFEPYIFGQRNVARPRTIGLALRYIF